MRKGVFTMKRIYRRLTAAVSAAVIAGGVLGALPVTAADQDLVILHSEAEALPVTTGGQVATKVYNDEYPGFSGEGFVWAQGSGGVKFEVDLEQGAMYEVKTRCLSYLGDRLQDLAVDGEKAAEINIQQTDTWTDVSFGFFYIPEGKHTIEIGSTGSWGYILYDTVTFGYAKMPEMKISPVPCDPKATAETKALMKFLTDNYGKRVITGQQEIYGSGHDGNYEYEFDYLKETTGKLPVVRGFDFMNYNPLYGWDDNTTERVIEWCKERNGIATASWHLNVPIDFAGYTLGDAVDWQHCTYKNYQASNSTFNTANILKEDSKERQYFDAAVKMLAEQLGRVQDAGVPVIFRPLHEAQGNYGRYGDGTAWFWWGDRGPEVYKELWKLLYTELTETYNLHNLIWEINLYETDTSDEWYPGGEWVDMIAYDKYEGSPTRWGTDPATSVFLKLVGYSGDTKMVALAECDRIPDIKKITNEGAWWSYVCPWYDEYITGESNNPKDLLKAFYNSEQVLTLDEVPADLYSADVPQQTTEPAKTTGPAETTEPAKTTAAPETTVLSSTAAGAATLRGDVTCDTKVDVSDAVLLARLLVEDREAVVTEQGKLNADMNQNGTPDPDDITLILKKIAKMI